jgi:hypothetical protein
MSTKHSSKILSNTAVCPTSSACVSCDEPITHEGQDAARLSVNGVDTVFALEESIEEDAPDDYENWVEYDQIFRAENPEMWEWNRQEDERLEFEFYEALYGPNSLHGLRRSRCQLIQEALSDPKALALLRRHVSLLHVDARPELFGDDFEILPEHLTPITLDPQEREVLQHYDLLFDHPVFFEDVSRGWPPPEDKDCTEEFSPEETTTGDE